MKKEVGLFVFLLFFFFVVVQAQEDQEKNGVVKYSGIVETGVVFSPNHCVLQQTIVNGMKIKNMHCLGFGVGIGGRFYGDDVDFYMPIYLNYRINFLPEKRSPFINIAAGAALTEEDVHLYSGLTAGIRFYKFTISSGLSLQTASTSGTGYDPLMPIIGSKTRLLVGCVIQVGIHF